MSCSGLHCAGCGAGASVPPFALAGLFGLAWVAGHIIEVAIVSAACAALAVAAAMWLERRSDRRAAEWGAARGIVSRADVILPPPPRAAAGLPLRQPPAIEQHVHYHYHQADGQQAPAITEGKRP